MKIAVRYGACCPDAAGAELTFFVTERPLEAGPYRLPGDRAKGAAKVYVAESVPGLIMQIQGEIEAAQAAGQAALRFGYMDDADAERLAERMTDSLIRRLGADDALWEQEPNWLARLEPLAEEGSQPLD